jgi:hypothetical protein
MVELSDTPPNKGMKLLKKQPRRQLEVRSFD